jgi:hypothetical protein
MAKTCSSCKRPVAGRFCSHCGTAAVASAACRECSGALQPGARFCNQCGAAAGAKHDRAAAGTGGSPAAWIVAAVAVVALLGVVLVPRFRSEAPTTTAFAPAAGAMGAPSGPQGVDLSSMTPREAADRLFDRIMRTASQGDSAQARSFVSMALDAYGQVPDLDNDALYHIGVLHLLNGNAEEARASADRILSVEPNHLFGLFTAAQAAAQQGNRAESVSLFRRFLESYPVEVARDLPEYTAHSPAFPEMRAEAQAAVQGS